MKAWRTTDGELRSIERPTPEPGDGEVRVAVEATVLSDADLAIAGDVTPGAAAVGRVEACGAAADHLAGVRVLIGPAWPCGECDVCRRGAAASCPRGRTLGATADGTLATHVIAPARWVCPLGDDLDLPGPLAALAARELALAYAMTARAGVGPGDPVVVAGDGVVSRLLFAIAVEKGTTPIAITGDDAFAADVERAGGRAIAEGGDLAAAAREAAAALQLGERPWRLFADASQPGECERLLALLGPGVTATLGGHAPPSAPPIAVPLARLAALGATVLGVASAHPDLLTEAAALAATGAIDLSAYAEVHPVDAGVPEVGRGRARVLSIAPTT